MPNIYPEPLFNSDAFDSSAGARASINQKACIRTPTSKEDKTARS